MTFDPASATNHLLTMAYGGPGKLEDVGPYLLDVRGYRPTPAHVTEEIRERYRQIGGRSPILDLTRAQAAGIERSLNEQAGDGESWKVWVAMRHWHPFIADVVREMETAGVGEAVSLVMAPHYSRMSVGAYQKRVADAEPAIAFSHIDQWNLLSGYLDAVTDRIGAALARFPAAERAKVPVIFTAHSLPERIREWDDPYERQLQATVAELRRRFPDQPSEWAFQSAAMTPDPWLGPDAGEVIQRLHGDGVRNVLICPIGFVCEHVEILFDIDVEFSNLAGALGMRLERIEMLNDHPLMLDALAGLVRATANVAGSPATSAPGSAARS